MMINRYKYLDNFTFKEVFFHHFFIHKNKFFQKNTFLIYNLLLKQKFEFLCK